MLYAANLLRIAVLVPMLRQSIVGAAVLAVDDANRNSSLLAGKRLIYTWMPVRCEDSYGATNAISQMFEKFPSEIDAVIGPDCSAACESSGYLTAARNIPQISYACTSEVLSARERYPTFVRTMWTWSSWVPAIIAFMKWARWSRLVSVSASTRDESDSYSSMAEHLASVMVADKDMRDPIRLQYSKTPPINFKDDVVAPLLTREYKVVLVLAELADTLAIARVAKAESAVFGGWRGWALLSLNAGNVADVTDNPTESIGEDMLGWVLFTSSSLVAPAFLSRVAASAGRAHPSLNIDSAGRAARASAYDHEAANPSASAANLYDAILLYAHAVGGHLAQLRDGAEMAKAMMGVSFVGMSGRVELDEVGSMRPSIQVSNCINHSSTGRPTMHVVGDFDAVNKAYRWKGESRFVWPGAVLDVLVAHSLQFRISAPRQRRRLQVPLDHQDSESCQPGWGLSENAKTCRLCAAGERERRRAKPLASEVGVDILAWQASSSLATKASVLTAT